MNNVYRVHVHRNSHYDCLDMNINPGKNISDKKYSEKMFRTKVINECNTQIAIDDLILHWKKCFEQKLFKKIILDETIRKKYFEQKLFEKNISDETMRKKCFEQKLFGKIFRTKQFEKNISNRGYLEKICRTKVI